MKNIVKIAVLMLSMWILPCSYTQAADSTSEVTSFVDNTAKRVMDIMNNAKLNSNNKQDALTNVFVEVVDIDFMARSALGAQWRTLNPESASQYLKAYRQYLISLYIPKFKYYHEHQYIIKSVTERSPGQYMVSMVLSNPDEDKQINLAYLLARTDHAFKIRDIMAENVSLLSTQRADFSSVLQQQGLEELSNMLEGKTGRNNES